MQLLIVALTILAACAEARYRSTWIAESINTFGSELYKDARYKAGNLVISPAAMGSSLFLAYVGAGGCTAKQLRKSLHLPRESRVVERAYQQLLSDINKESRFVNISSALFVQNGVHVKNPFRSAAGKSFSAEILELDFAGDYVQARSDINEWVYEATNGDIQNLLNNWTLSEETQMVLTNVVTMEAKWEVEFEYISRAAREAFHTADGREIREFLAGAQGNFSYSYQPSLQTEFLLMRFKETDIKMMILLPREIDGLDYLEENLSNVNFTRILRTMEKKYIRIAMPLLRAEAEQNYEFNLRNMGMYRMFSPRANFKQITDNKISMSSVVQKFKFQVGMDRSRGATGVGVQFRSLPEPEFVLRMDHPFMYAVFGPQDALLFLGRYKGRDSDN